MTSDPESLVTKAELELCRRDKERWISHLTIKDKKGWVGRIADHPEFQGLKPPQRKLLALKAYCRERGWPCRILVLKARKTGISTVVEADMFLEVLENQYDALVLAHDKETSKYILNMTHTFYEHYPFEKPPTQRSSIWEIDFAHPHMGLLKVETANNPQAGTGLTPQYIHGSEVAKWERGPETAIALFQSIGDGPNTTMILESTAYGYDGLFQPMWENADLNCSLTWSQDKDGNWIPDINITNPEEWNGYLPLFISWFDDPECRKDLDEAEEARLSQTLDDHEKMLMERYQVTLEGLNWRRWKIRRDCQGSLDVFRQEYPATPEEAFIASGRPRLSHEALNAQPLETGHRVTLQRSSTWAKAINIVSDVQSPLTIYRKPVPGHRYVIGIDTATGLQPEEAKDPDESVAIVLDMDNFNEEVAVFAGHIGEEYLVEPLLLLGEYYNWAYMVPETTSYGLHVTISLSQNYPRDRIYRRPSLKGRGNRAEQLGFKTHNNTRNELISRLASAISEKDVVLHCKKTILQCKKLEYSRSGKVEAARGEHDDYCFALALALTGVEHYPESLKTMHRRPSELYERSHGASTPEPPSWGGY